MSNIDQLTYGELKTIAKLFGNQEGGNKGIQTFVGQRVIVRTYSAGVWFGEVIEKDGEEVILKNGRRLWKWKTANCGISLSEIAIAGLDGDESKVCSPVDVWLTAIEIIPCSAIAIKNIEDQNEYRA